MQLHAFSQVLKAENCHDNSGSHHACRLLGASKADQCDCVEAETTGLLGVEHWNVQYNQPQVIVSSSNDI